MITTYTASPKTIDKADLENVGTGYGVLRHGYGMYFGTPKVVEKYFNDYEEYRQAERQVHFGAFVASEGTPEFDVMNELHQGKTLDEVDLENINESLAESLSDEFSDYSEHEIIIRHGVVHSVELNDLSPEDINDWDETISDEARLEKIQVAVLSEFYRERGMPPLDFQAMNLDDDYGPDDIAALLDDMFDEAYSAALDNDEWMSTPEHLLREAWDYVVRGDEGTEPNAYDEFIEGLPEVYDNALRAMVMPGLNLTVDSTTYGDLVQHVQSFFEINKKANPGLESARLLTEMNIPALTGKAHGVDAKELVVYSEKVLANATFTPISIETLKEAFEQTPDLELDNDRGYAPSYY